MSPLLRGSSQSHTVRRSYIKSMFLLAPSPVPCLQLSYAISHNPDKNGDAVRGRNMTNGLRTPLTAKALENLQEGQKLTDGGFDPDNELRGALKGSLVARRRQGRTMIEFFLRMRAGGKDVTHKVGTYAPKGGGLGLAEARALALDMARKYAAEGEGYKAAREAEETARKAAEEAARQARARDEADSKGEGSLEALLLAYVADMRVRGRSSADDVEGLFRRHVELAHPDLWNKPARLVTREDIHAILGRMLDAGIGRRVNMLRSCVKSAYAFGLYLADDPKHHQDARRFMLTSNPAATIRRRTELDRKGERALSTSELGAYLRALDGIQSAPLRVFLTTHIGLAGQRIAQLLRLKRTDYQDGTLRIIDGKGRGTPRQHLVPVPEWVAEQVQLIDGLSETWLFTTDGENPIAESTISHAVGEISARLVEAGEVSAPFKASDLRRTAETLLARLRVSKDTRIELLSHGRNSLVAGHYDRHTYLDEKREALDVWGRALHEWKGGNADNVVPLRARAA